MELAFAGLQQLCAPLLDRLERLPGPQRDALGTAFGLRDGDAPDRFLVGLAVLSLLSEAAEERPLVCVVDDAQWLDRASAQALAFVARRLVAESVGLVFAVREPAGERHFDGLAGARRRRAGRRRCAGAAGGRGRRVRSTSACATGSWPRRAATRWRCWSCRAAGRPRSWRAGSGCRRRPAAVRAASRRASSERLEALPPATRRLLLVAAAEPVGDPLLLWRRPPRSGSAPARRRRPTAAGLIELGAQVRFRHPLVRSAVYRRAPRRRTAGASTARSPRPPTPSVDPDRRAWHRAQATAGLDEDVAAELERSAGRAQARGGLAAAAAFLERAAELTPDPARRARRALAAAQAKHQAGAPDAALRLLAMAEAGPLDELEQRAGAAAARADRVRHDARPRRAAAAARGGQAARAARRDARARDLPRRVRRGARRPTAWCAAATRARSPPRSSPPTGSRPRARVRSAARRARAAYHRGLRRRRAGAEGAR